MKVLLIEQDYKSDLEMAVNKELNKNRKSNKYKVKDIKYSCCSSKSGRRYSAMIIFETEK